ncbi:hypothetical protein F2Q69_00033289 [Brassica cretica]|uniref:Uncharacterized protein n=1 Tax=Brassica cretica TaxID=69181 RepID=A0A8S9STU6_BRACR|nr:hypothetical protein F2Q69_00033289 [Brassica cretica]
MNASNDQYERTPIRYRDAQPHIATRWNPNYGILESQHFVEPNITRHFLHEEDVRIHAEYSSIPSSTHYGLHPNIMMNASNDQYERTPIRYRDAQPHIATSWNPNYGILESQHFVEPNITKHFLHEDQRNKLGSGIQMNFETSDATEPDLELRLSL